MDIFSTAVLALVVAELPLPAPFILNSFFRAIQTESSEEIHFDIDSGSRRLAPFVSPIVAGQVVQSKGYQTKSFKPAYIKDKRAPDLRKPIRRMMGERIGGELSASEREQANLTFELTDQIDMINRRLEWMAAQALLTGTVTIAGDGFPTTLIEFGRASGLTLTLAGGVQWTNANIASGAARPTADLETWALKVLKESGAVVEDVVFSTDAWQQFLLDPVLKAVAWYPNQGGNNAVELGAQIVKGAQSKGKWGNYNLWVYNDWYVDDNNVEQPMIPNGTVIMSGSQLMGTRSFGAILDPKFAYGALPYAPKSWVQEDPAQRFLLMQSAPIVIPSRANGAIAVAVK